MIKWLKTRSSGAHFDQVVRAYSSQLYQYAYWLCRDKHRAEDVLQEAFVRAWKNWEQVEDESARRSWLYTIVRNEFLRGAQREPNAIESLDVGREDEGEESLQAIDRIDERDFTRGLEIRQLLGRLPEVHLEPLLLQCLVGMSCDEIANVLGISAAATMTRMTRARLVLRDLLAEPAQTAPAAADGPKLRVVRNGVSK